MAPCLARTPFAGGRQTREEVLRGPGTTSSKFSTRLDPIEEIFQAYQLVDEVLLPLLRIEEKALRVVLLLPMRPPPRRYILRGLSA